jgi:hypothetical protein
MLSRPFLLLQLRILLCVHCSKLKDCCVFYACVQSLTVLNLYAGEGTDRIGVPTTTLPPCSAPTSPRAPSGSCTRRSPSPPVRYAYLLLSAISLSQHGMQQTPERIPFTCAVVLFCNMQTTDTIHINQPLAP